MTQQMQIDKEIGLALERGSTLPAAWYTDASVFEAEKARIFNRSWQYAGHLAQVASPGDFFTAALGDVPVIVVRGDDGALRALANVCRHRGSEVVLDCAGSRRTLQCHYHGWTYNLDGSLRAAPRSAEQESFAAAELGLAQLSVTTFGPAIFVNPDPACEPLERIFAGIPELVARAGVDLRELQMRRRDLYDIACNWKIAVENFNECYHCPVAHPAFSRMIDTDAYRVETGHEMYSSYFGPLKSAPDRGVSYLTLWPNTMLALTSNPPGMMVMAARPVDSGHTHETIDYYLPQSLSDREMADYVGMSDLVQREDVVLCESVQRGLRSGVVKTGRLMLSRERGIQHFQKLVYRFLSAAG